MNNGWQPSGTLGFSTRPCGFALPLYQVKGLSNEEVADYLSFSDPANFRRSFKRWTGSTPNLIRPLFGSH